MSRRSLSHLSAQALLERLRELTARDRHLTVEILEVLMEADWRRLWAKAGDPSMYAWCMAEFGYSEDQAAKRICGARQARKHPEILDMVADGRLHLSVLIVLAPKLDAAPERAAELLAASAGRSRRAIEALLAERFPQADLPTRVVPMGAPSAPPSPAPGRVEAGGLPAPAAAVTPAPPAPGRVEAAGQTGLESSGVEAAEPKGDAPVDAPVPAPGRVAPSYPRTTPLAPGRYAVQFTMSQQMHDKLQRAKELLSHAMPGADVPALLERALDELIVTLEKRRFAATDRPRQPKPARARTNPQDISAQVRRNVWKRDAGACTWLVDGRRCGSRIGVEFHHDDPVGKGDGTTVPSEKTVRLLCRAHNRLQAERDFGEGLVHERIERSRRAAAERRAGNGAARANPRTASAMTAAPGPAPAAT